MKEQLRNEFKRLRDEIKPPIDYSDSIKNALFSLPEYKAAKSVLFYVSFGSEVETHEMIKQALKEKIVCVPKTKEKIIPIRINSFNELSEKNKYGILEPKNNQTTNFELAVVPGIIFDTNGNRIGFGKGYYDHMFKDHKCKKIAICFDFQLIDQIPYEPHDIKMDIIITEKRKIYIEK